MAYGSNLFAQIVKLVPRVVFEDLVARTGTQRCAKGFNSWDHLVAMLFCQFAQAKSLREISDGLRTTCGKLNHLGMAQSPAKSTLSYANAHRSCELFERLFYDILRRCQAESPGKKRKFRFKCKLLSLDATTIDLCLALFPWARFRQTKGAVKLHLLLDHDGYLPIFANITEGRTNEVRVAQGLTLPRGSIVAMDRGYCDAALYQRWTDEGVYFVTRLKENTTYDVVKEQTIPGRGHVVLDQCIRFNGRRTRLRCPSVLRRIVVWDDTNQREIVLLTNHLAFAASTISAIYKDRWEIELFFKAIKQHLKIKTFVGTSENALKTQIWTALITILLIKYMQFRSQCALPLCRLVALLRWNLFTYRHLWDWLNNPFDVPPEVPAHQLAFPFGIASAENAI